MCLVSCGGGGADVCISQEKRMGEENNGVGLVIIVVSLLLCHLWLLSLLCDSLQNEDLLFVVQFVKNHRQ